MYIPQRGALPPCVAAAMFKVFPGEGVDKRGLCQVLVYSLCIRLSDGREVEKGSVQ